MTEWMNEVARLLNGSFDNDSDGTPVLCVDPGDGVGANTYSFAELTQMYNSRISAREAADIIRMGGLP